MQRPMSKRSPHSWKVRTAGEWDSPGPARHRNIDSHASVAHKRHTPTIMEKLPLYIGISALVLLGIYGLCMWMVRIEDRRQERRR